MNYLGRPIFQFALNWSSQPTKSFSYDLRELQIGFGKRRAAALQSYVVQGFEISLDLLTPADVLAFEDFFAALKGRLKGFWFPSPLTAMKITKREDNVIYIEDQELRETFDTRPDIHLYFFKEGQAPQIAKIESVADAGANREEVALLTPVTVDPTWSVCRLHYVRLAGDDEPATQAAEGRQQRTLRVVELPTEYTAPETGEEKIYLYHFWLSTDTPAHWRFTSFDQDVLSGGQNFISSAITHGSLRSAARGDREDTTIEAFYESGHPLALFAPLPPAKPMHVQILETTLGDPDATEIIFTGFVLEAPKRGHKITAKCSSFLDVLGQRVLSMILQPRCNYSVFEPSTCKLNKAAYAKAVTITRIAGNVVRIKGAGLVGKEEHAFALGWIETGVAAQFEMRSVLANSKAEGNEMNVVLDAGLAFVMEDQAATIYPGCDGLSETCKVKFNNFDNWGGHRVALENPTIKGIENFADHPNKK